MSRLFALAIGCLVLQGSLSALAADLKLGDLGYNDGTNGNPHNLSSLADPTPRPHVPLRLPGSLPKATDTTEICVFCHTPHGATPQSTLWNRINPASMGSFPIFNSVYTMDPSGVFAIADPAVIATTKYGVNDASNEYPNGATKLCLSCHDGVTSIGVLADGRSVTMSQDTITEPTMFWDPVSGSGMDFSKSHPVSFVYNQAVVDFINNDTLKSDDYKLPAATSRIKLDGERRMQCTTCHEPHFDTKATGYSYPFWRNAGVGADAAADYDATCAECHTPRRTLTPHNI